MKRRIENIDDLYEVIDVLKDEKNIPWEEIYDKADLSVGLVSRWKKHKANPSLINVISLLSVFEAYLYIDTSNDDFLKKNHPVSTRQIELIKAINSYLDDNKKSTNKDIEKIVTIATSSNFSYNDLLGVFLLFLLKVKQPT